MQVLHFWFSNLGGARLKSKGTGIKRPLILKLELSGGRAASRLLASLCGRARKKSKGTGL